METLHTPAAMRKTGLVSLKHYLKYGLFALLYIIFVSRYIWNKEGFSDWTLKDLFFNDGEMIKFYLLSAILILFVLYLLFGSKYGVYRLVIAKNLYVFTAIFSFIYLAVLFIFEFDYHKISTPEQISLAIIAGIFTLIAILPAVFEKSEKVVRYVGLILPVFLIISIFVVQYWHKDEHLWHVIWMFICPFLFFFVKPTS